MICVYLHFAPRFFVEVRMIYQIKLFTTMRGSYRQLTVFGGIWRRFRRCPNADLLSFACMSFSFV
jgi:hypothetical protein